MAAAPGHKGIQHMQVPKNVSANLAEERLRVLRDSRMAASLQVTGTLRLHQRAPCKTVG